MYCVVLIVELAWWMSKKWNNSECEQKQRQLNHTPYLKIVVEIESVEYNKKNKNTK